MSESRPPSSSVRPTPSGDDPHKVDASRPTATPGPAPRCTSGADDAVVCERCGASMFRMHAVWRCPNCGYKTDCCGW
ncbi:MAG TPA: hypothetical protein VHD57_12920 [Vicinamibacterales bacterium]|nr:hypothetical protein [Vicinamibacterales bacterium]